MSQAVSTLTWREILAQNPPASSNVSGILISTESGSVKLAKQTDFGEEYVACAPDAATAWERLARITGSSVLELKRLRITKVS